MRLSRIIMALTVGLAVVAAPTAAGAAQSQPALKAPQPPPDYVPGPATLTLNRTTITLGQSVVLTGTNFCANETVRIVVSIAPLAAPLPGQAPARRSDGSTVAMAAVAYAPQPSPLEFTAETNANGRFTRSYRPSEAGQYTFTATGEECKKVASASLTVLKKRKPHGGGNLPVTGDDMGTPLKVGGGLVGAGMVLMLGTLAWRRRNRFNEG